MNNNNVIYKCKVNGIVGRQGKYSAMCPKIRVGDSGLCGESGECHWGHKIEVKSTEETTTVHGIKIQ